MFKYKFRVYKVILFWIEINFACSFSQAHINGRNKFYCLLVLMFIEIQTESFLNDEFNSRTIEILKKVSRITNKSLYIIFKFTY